MKNLKLVLAALTALAILSGCNDSDSSVAAPAVTTDSVTILKVSPSSAVAGVPTDFVVEVAYTLASDSDGVLDIGFNNYNDANSFILLSNLGQVVEKGSGKATFTATGIIPVDWSPDKFMVTAYLSENPKPNSWTPYAAESAEIALSAATAKAATDEAGNIGEPVSSVICYQTAGVDNFCVAFE